MIRALLRKREPIASLQGEDHCRSEDNITDTPANPVTVAQTKPPPMSHIRHHVSVAANRLSKGGLHRYATRKLPVLVKRTINCPHWPQDLDGFHILHLSDFHIGQLLTTAQALELIAVARQTIGPVDLLAMTGDLIDFDDFASARPVLDCLSDYPARFGAWAVSGNHDLLVDQRQFAEIYVGSGVRLLSNESELVEIPGQSALLISGIEWAKRRRQRARLVKRSCHWPAGQGVNAACHGSMTRPAHILLTHHPDGFRAASRVREPEVDLVLSGHTHGGQINFRHTCPGHASRLPRGSLSVMRHRYQWGVFRRGCCRLHVTSGVGSWFPVRLKCPSEIALLTVRSAPMAG